MSSIENELLKRTSSIRKKYKFLDEKTGRRFNLYSIARTERKEEQTHSRMIAELLNPRGSHGQGGAFLDLFLRAVGITSDDSVSHRKTSVTSEKLFADEGNTGRVDIVVNMSKLLLLIENKIDAQDQDRQLERYWRYAAGFKQPAIVIYLTLDGREPSRQSLGSIMFPVIKADGFAETGFDQDRVPNIRLVSYARDIIPWLESCVCYCIQNNLSQIALAINHYTMVVRKIAGKEMNDDEFNEIVALLMGDPDNVLSPLNISQVFGNARFRGHLLSDFMARMKAKIELDSHFSYTEVLPDRLKSFQANEENLTRWCERGNKSAGWECKGLFFTAPGGSYLLHIQFATDAFHYGLVPLGSDMNLASESLGSYEWQKRDWPKLVWFSRMEVGNAKDFGQDFIRLATDASKISGLAKRIVSEASDLLSLARANAGAAGTAVPREG